MPFQGGSYPTRSPRTTVGRPHGHSLSARSLCLTTILHLTKRLKNDSTSRQIIDRRLDRLSGHAIPARSDFARCVRNVGYNTLGEDSRRVARRRILSLVVPRRAPTACESIASLGSQFRFRSSGRRHDGDFSVGHTSAFYSQSTACWTGKLRDNLGVEELPIQCYV